MQQRLRGSSVEGSDGARYVRGERIEESVCTVAKRSRRSKYVRVYSAVVTVTPKLSMCRHRASSARSRCCTRVRDRKWGRALDKVFLYEGIAMGF